MSLLRSSPALPRNTVLRLSPWLIVGSAVILGLAIAFWAVKNARQERENMTRNLLDRSGALIWALEGGVRAGMGMRVSASHLQYLIEETAKQPGIAYMAVVTWQGFILAHSDRNRIGDEMYPPETMTDLAPSTLTRWRVVQTQKGGEAFEVYKIFSPLPGFRDHMRGQGGFRRSQANGTGRAPEAHGELDGHSGGHDGMCLREGRRRKPIALLGPNTSDDDRKEVVIIVGLDMKAFEDSLAADLRSTVVTALLVGLLGVGGLLSLFWAQSYKLSRRLLQDTRAFAAEVITSLPLGLLILDASGRVSQSNAVAERILGQSAPDLLGKRPEDLEGAEGADWKALAARVREGQAVLEEEHLLFPPGQPPEATAESLPVSVSASRILNDEGQNIGMIFLLRDLREVKRLQEQLRRSERLSTLGNMAARVAHEIRNPLSSIKGFATYLGARHNNDQDREAARAMTGEVDRLNRVVSELLDFARPSNLRIAPASLDDILRRALRLVEPDISAKNIDLRFEPSGLFPSPMVAVDAERITQALLNLFLNAVQATDPDGSLSVAVLPPEGDRMAVVIADSGRGMPPDVLAQIFSPYFTTKASGTGLGLSIVHKIVEDHNAEIKVASAEGQGTTVTLWLPLAGHTEEEGERS